MSLHKGDRNYLAAEVVLGVIIAMYSLSIWMHNREKDKITPVQTASTVTSSPSEITKAQLTPPAKQLAIEQLPALPKLNPNSAILEALVSKKKLKAVQERAQQFNLSCHNVEVCLVFLKRLDRNKELQTAFQVAKDRGVSIGLFTNAEMSPNYTIGSGTIIINPWIDDNGIISILLGTTESNK